MTRTNLVYNPSATLGTGGTDGWTALGSASLSRDDVSSYIGDGSFKIINSTGAANAGLRTSSPISVFGGKTYTVSVYSYLPAYEPDTTEDTPLRLKIDWYNVSNTLISSVTSDIVTVLVESDWHDKRLTYIGNAPIDAVYAYLSVYQTSIGTAGQVWLVDAWLMEQSEYIGEYFGNLTQDEENKYVKTALTAVPVPNITGMQLNADIAIADLVLNTIDEDGTVWVCTEIDGWWTTAQPEVPDITRGTQDGSFDITGRYASRQITLSGVFVPQDPSNISKAREKLIKAINLVRKSAWLRTDEQPTKASKVWLVGQPSIQTVNARGRTEFSIPLRSPDPIKYQWNDDSQDGTTTISVLAKNSKPVVNDGNTRVTAYLELTGPLGTGSTITSTSKLGTESITTSFGLRGPGVVCDLTGVSRASDIVTVTTDYISGLEVGDTVSLYGVPTSSPNLAPSGGTVTVTSVSNDSPYTFSYTYAGSDTDDTLTLSGATASILTADTLGIDTYNQTVIFNEDSSGHRAKLEPLIDWMKFEQGHTTLEFRENIVPYKVRKKSYSASNGKATLVFDRAHQLVPGVLLDIVLPDSRIITAKVLTSNVATLTTEEPHGYAVGDRITVQVTTTNTVTSKAVTYSSGGNETITLTTAATHGIATNDIVRVELPTTSTVTAKQAVAATGAVTLRTSTSHGFSVGDVVDITMPVLAYVSKKKADSGVVTLTTASNHNFSDGDELEISLPTSATYTTKTITSAGVTLTTSSAHGFSQGDVVSVVAPVTATISNYKFGGSTVAGEYYTVTITATAHGFDIGDQITVAAVTNTGSNGTFYIDSVAPNTFTYLYYGSETAVGTMSDSGTVTNLTNKIITDNDGTASKVLTSVTTTTMTYAR